MAYVSKVSLPSWLRYLVHTGDASPIRYGVIGLLSATLDFLVFSLLIYTQVSPLFAAAFGTISGISNSYVLNSIFNFRLRLDARRAFKFLAVGASGLVSATSLFFLLSLAGIEPNLAKLLSIIPIAILQFLANRFWTFRAGLGKPR